MTTVIFPDNTLVIDSGGGFEGLQLFLRNIMEPVRTTLLRGVFTLLPLILCFYLMVLFVTWTDGYIVTFLPAESYVPGLGVLLILCIFYIVGLLGAGWSGQQLINLVDRSLAKIPIINTINSSLRDLGRYFVPAERDALNKVVRVYLPHLESSLLGFQTCTDCEFLRNGSTIPNLVGVYLPMSYQFGGYTVFVPAEQVTAIDMTTEDAWRFILTGGVSGPTNNGSSDTGAQRTSTASQQSTQPQTVTSP